MLSVTKSKQENCTETDLEEETKKPAALYLQDKQTNRRRKCTQIVQSINIPGKLDQGSMRGLLSKGTYTLLKKQMLLFKVKICKGKFNQTPE